MTMHLERGLSTTSTRKRKQKITKAQLADFEQGWRDRNVRLKDMGLPKETFEQYMDWVHGRSKEKKTKKNYIQPRTAPVTTNDTTARRGPAPSPATVQGTTEANISGMGTPANWKAMVGACSSKPSPTYTGTKMIGIATMHKSNMVPVFSDTEAEEISRMRR